MAALKASNGCAPTRRVPLTKKVGVPVTPKAAPSLSSASTLSLNLPESSAALNLRHVEAQLLRVLLERRAIERLLVGEQLVVHLPELPLLVGGQRRLGRQVGLVVERQRELLEGDAQLPLVVGLELPHRRHRAAAERALEVAPGHQRDRRRGRTLDRRVADLDVELAALVVGRARRRRRGAGASAAVSIRLV